MNIKSVLKKINIFTFTVSVLVLIILVYRTSDLLVSNSLNDYFKLDKKTSSYISFNYAGGDINSIYEIDNPKIYSDFKGKRFVNDYYDFEIEIPEDKKSSEVVNYDILLKDMGNDIESKFIKVYLTNQNNKVLKGFDKTVPVYSAFLNGIDGKVIYSGIINGNNSNKFRLRIWISDIYKSKFNSKLAYQVKVKIN